MTNTYYGSRLYHYIVPDYMVSCPPDEGRYMLEEGSYTGTILDKACDSDNCPIKCFRHHITPSATRRALYGVSSIL